MNSGLSPGDTPDYEHRMAYSHYAAILIAQGKLHEANDILDRLTSILEKAGALTPLLETLTQQIIILHALEEDEKALAFLQHTPESGET